MNTKSAGISFAAVATSIFLAAQSQPAGEPIVRLTAVTANVAGAPDPIRLDVLRWSTDAERDQLVLAWTQPNPPAPAGGRAGRGGRGAAADAAPDPAAAAGNGAAPAAARGGAAAAGRGGAGGRGGRGGGRGAAAPAVPLTPEGSLAAALEKAPTVGYLWSSEVAGYSIRYAAKFAEADGSQRVVLVTDRRLGAWSDVWKPTGADAATNYEFSIIEVHLPAKGDGEGRASLTGKIAIDGAAKTIGLENYTALPVILKNVKRKTG